MVFSLLLLPPYGLDLGELGLHHRVSRGGVLPDGEHPAAQTAHTGERARRPDVQASGGREVVGDSFFGNVVSASHMARSSRDCTNPSSAVLLVVAAWLWLLLSASGVLADGGKGTMCLCMGPQCVPPCPVPGTPTPTTSPTEFPFCPQRPPAVGPFPCAASRRSPPP